MYTVKLKQGLVFTLLHVVACTGYPQAEKHYVKTQNVIYILLITFHVFT